MARSACVSICKLARRALRYGLMIGAVSVLRSQSAPCADEIRFPYTAYVVADKAYVRSGPGQRHYPTQTLPPGYAVEVCRHDADGWCAIRPPAESFSWIPRLDVRQLDQQRGEVSASRALARVGSHITGEKSAVQVLIPRGTQVDFNPTDAPDSRAWLRIAPPNGEFRWIAAGDLARQPPLESRSPIALVADWNRQSADTDDHPQHTDFDHLLSTAAPEQPAFDGTSLPKPRPVQERSARSKEPHGAPQADDVTDEVEFIAGSPAATDQEAGTSGVSPQPGPPEREPSGRDQAQAAFDAQGAPTAGGPRIQFRGITPPLAPSGDPIADFQLRLSQIVVLPKEQWDFTPLRDEVLGVWENTDSVSQRERLDALLKRIASFQQAQRGVAADRLPQVSAESHGQSSDGHTGQTSRVRQLAGEDLETQDPFELTATGGDQPLYDAVGTLKPVVSRDEQAPRYALIDDRGDIVSFVTPTPNLNLAPYIGRQIGVRGTRGFIPEYRRAHVTAGRVTPIDDRIRR